jgi:succinate dehydrogenase / fumarate reductase cytochrome b subunit
MYRIREGMVAWILHRLTGVGVALFLAVHVLDTFLLGWGPEVYNAALEIYQSGPFRLLEVGLLGAVLFHALNGLRIILIDFWDRGTAHHRGLFYGELLVFLALFLPASYWMLSPLL